MLKHSRGAQRPRYRRRVKPLAQMDLDHVMAHTAPLWEELRGERILLTGGTGFYGRWLIESFLDANRKLSLGAEMVVLSRRPAAFLAQAPHLAEAGPMLRWIEGDIRTFTYPYEQVGYILHAAADSVLPASCTPAEEYSMLVDGARQVLQVAEATGCKRLLLASSGAVYGAQPEAVSYLDEQHAFAASTSAYALGKRDAEAMCAKAGLHASMARGFSFLGPHLPMDAHFAAGNFLRDALIGKDILITGNRRAVRTYLHAADLAVWLWTMLLKGESGSAYNVGSEETVSILELAERMVANVRTESTIRLAQSSRLEGGVARYAPSTRKAQTELGLEVWIGLDEAIRRTAAWYRNELV